MARSLSFAPPLPRSLDVPEGLAVRRLTLRGKPALLITGADDRGVMYALLDAAERVASTGDAADLFSDIHDVDEQPAIRDRALSVYAMNRAHWESRFYDEQYWTRYFDLIAASRFNRFLIVFGYENGGFLAPPYPYFFDTPGFSGVRMVGLLPEQQQRNLAALNRLIELAHERGIGVTLGIWDHIYRGGVQTGGAEWVKRLHQGRPIPNSVVGVTTDNLKPYTHASLRELLVRVPTVDALQFRVHEESGLKREEMEGFWHTVFQHLRETKPGILVELRGKGTPDAVIDDALTQGVNLRIETKYWMEQLGLPFHPVHVTPPDQGNRRHGYADFLRYPQRYQMTWRLWNGGTTRILLWGDPDYVRRYGADDRALRQPELGHQRTARHQDGGATAGHADIRPTAGKIPRYYDYEFEHATGTSSSSGAASATIPPPPPTCGSASFNAASGAAAPHVEAGLHRASQVLPMIVAAVYPSMPGSPPRAAGQSARVWASRLPTTRGTRPRTQGCSRVSPVRRTGFSRAGPPRKSPQTPRAGGSTRRPTQFSPRCDRPRRASAENVATNSTQRSPI